jgi:hypothetical protein
MQKTEKSTAFHTWNQGGPENRQAQSFQGIVTEGDPEKKPWRRDIGFRILYSQSLHCEIKGMCLNHVNFTKDGQSHFLSKVFYLQIIGSVIRLSN